MALLHGLRRAASRLGLDVRRLGDTSPAQLAALLRHRGVDLVLDVGANRGQFARRLRAHGYTRAISSFEPLPEAYRDLEDAAAADPAWNVYPLALGDANKSVSLNVAGNEGASSSVLPMLERHQRAAPDAAYVASVEVEMRRLDGLWPDVVPAGAAPFMKVDVQGFEGRVLDGAGDRLAELAGIQLEISLVPVYEGGLSLSDALARMEALGLTLVHVEPGFRDPGSAELLQIDGAFMRASGA